LIIHLNTDVPLLNFNTHPTFPFSVIEQLYWDPYETLEAPSKAIHRDAFWVIITLVSSSAFLDNESEGSHENMASITSLVTSYGSEAS
jgi:hypothetical protein